MNKSNNWWRICCLMWALVGCADTKPTPTASQQPAATAPAQDFWVEQRRIIAERKAREELEDEQRRAALAAEIKSRPTAKQQYLDDHPELSPAIRDAILQRSFVLGMTMKEVELALGAPNRRTHYESTTGSADLWSYGHTTLFFRNGVLESWSDAK